jgi:predicted metal-dependent HD superfamily phosphohydrolase
MQNHSDLHIRQHAWYGKLLKDASQLRQWLIDIKLALITQGIHDLFYDSKKKNGELQVTSHEKFIRAAFGT